VATCGRTLAGSARFGFPKAAALNACGLFCTWMYVSCARRACRLMQDPEQPETGRFPPITEKE
jgi:hypothetical protein